MFELFFDVRHFKTPMSGQTESFANCTSIQERHQWLRFGSYRMNDNFEAVLLHDVDAMTVPDCKVIDLTCYCEGEGCPLCTEILW